MMAGALTVQLPELHHPVSGRLDAQRVADFLHVPLSQLARATGRKYQSLHKTPDAPAVQEALFPIKHSLEILATVVGDPAMIRAWLNSPHPDLGRRTPLQVMLDGHAEVVEGMLEDAMAGAPS